MSEGLSKDPAPALIQKEELPRELDTKARKNRSKQLPAKAGSFSLGNYMRDLALYQRR